MMEKYIILKGEKEMLEQEKVLSVKDWLKVWLIMMIPIVNIVMWIKWLVSDKTNYNLKNYLISCLVVMAIGALLWFMFFGVMMGAIIATTPQ